MVKRAQISQEDADLPQRQLEAKIGIGTSGRHQVAMRATSGEDTTQCTGRVDQLEERRTAKRAPNGQNDAEWPGKHQSAKAVEKW